MKSFILVIILGVGLLSSSVAAAEAPPWAPPEAVFVGSTAYTLEQGRFEVGLFGPLRYGVTDRIELSGHPLWFFVAPNVRAKFAWIDGGDTQVSWNTGVTYPTPLLRLLSRSGAGGVHPPDRAVPQIISLFNELVATRGFGEHLFSVAGGLQLAPRFGDNEMVSIDVPVVYPRTAAFFTTATGLARVELQGPIAGAFHYKAGLRGFVYPGADGGFAVEQEGQLRFQPSERFLVQAGYLLSYAGFPFGESVDVLPVVDLVWGF